MPRKKSITVRTSQQRLRIAALTILASFAEQQKPPIENRGKSSQSLLNFSFKQNTH